MAVKLFILLILVSVQALGQGKIEGYVIDKTTGKPLAGTRISLYVYVSDSSLVNNPYYQENVKFGLTKPDVRDTIYKRIESVYSDSSGYYMFQEVASNTYRLSAFHQISQEENRQYGESENTNGFVVSSGTHLMQDFTLAVFCPYDQTKDLTDCPKCKMKDKVLLIRYGMPVYPFKPEPGYYYNGYCVVERCHPTKRCMRCEYEF